MDDFLNHAPDQDAPDEVHVVQFDPQTRTRIEQTASGYYVKPEWPIKTGLLPVLGPAALRVYDVLCFHANVKALAWPRPLTIARQLQTNKGTIRRALAELRKWQLIKFHRKGGGGGQYTIHRIVMSEDEAQSLGFQPPLPFSQRARPARASGARPARASADLSLSMEHHHRKQQQGNDAAAASAALLGEIRDPNGHGFDAAAIESLSTHPNCSPGQIGIAKQRADDVAKRGKLRGTYLAYVANAIREKYGPLASAQDRRIQALPEHAQEQVSMAREEAARIRAQDKRERERLAAIPPEQLAELVELAIAQASTAVLKVAWGKQRNDPAAFPMLRGKVIELHERQMNSMKGAAEK